MIFFEGGHSLGNFTHPDRPFRSSAQVKIPPTIWSQALHYLNKKRQACPHRWAGWHSNGLSLIIYRPLIFLITFDPTYISSSQKNSQSVVGLVLYILWEIFLNFLQFLKTNGSIDCLSLRWHVNDQQYHRKMRIYRRFMTLMTVMTVFNNTYHLCSN